ncbi:MAG: type II secretion system GspH family protein [Desulfobulbaceae bacterium]|nr:type II secretion system GspH family protein [Desulfobulbaceae bacterium]
MLQRSRTPQILTKQGFTVIEVIVVLMLLGIMSAVVVGRLLDTSADLAAESEIVKTHLRFVQSRAMNSAVSWGIRFDGGSYTMLTDGLTSSGFLPNESSATRSLAVGTVAASTNPIIFDQWGSPGNVDITVTVSDSSGSKSFVIIRNTGGIL